MARPTHDKVHETRRRELLVTRWQNQIMHGALDAHSIEQGMQRALADPDVRMDAVAAAEIRAFCQERLREFENAGRVANGRANNHPGAHAAGHPPEGHQPNETDVRAAARRLVEQFNTYIGRFFESEAEALLARIDSLHHAHPNWLPQATVKECRRLLNELPARRGELQKRIVAASRRAVRAAAKGDHDTSAKLLRRLSAVNAAFPHVYHSEALAKLRLEMGKASTVHEHAAAIARLVERERTLAAEIKHLVAAIHAFHEIARTLPHSEPEFLEAERKYRAAMDDLRGHDEEWLSGTILELVDLLGDWAHPPARVGTQLDRFINSIKSALRIAKKEVREIETDSGRDDPNA